MARTAYLKRMHDRFGFLATWLPGQRLDLGSIGVLHAGEFQLKTSLDALKIKFRSRRATTGPDFDHQYGASVSFDASASAKTAEGTRASANLRFDSGEGFLFRARNCAEHVIEDLADVEEEILELHRDKIWKKEWVLVHRLYCAASSTIIVSEGNAAHVVIEGRGAAPRDFADAALDLRCSIQSGDVTTLIAESGLTPIYQASRVVDRWWSATQMKPVSPVLGGQGFVTVSLDDALLSNPEAV